MSTLTFADDMARSQRALAQCHDMVVRRTAVLEALRLRGRERVLEVGCGGGAYAYEAAQCVGPTGRVCALDVSADQIASAKARCAELAWVEYQVADAVKLPYGDAEFDALYGVQVFEYVLLAGGPTGMRIQPVVMIRGADEAETAFATMVRDRADAVIVQGSLAVQSLTDVAIKHRVPTASTTRSFADIGGLMVFGADGPAAVRHGATFVHRILQGRQPKDMPVEQPTKFELAINLKTARAIGLKIPPAFLLRADVVLE